MALRNQPYIPLYVQDYLTDEKLNECSPASQGIYIKLMCLMHKSEEYGCVLLEQKYKQHDKPMLNFALKLVKHLPFSEIDLYLSLEDLLENDVIQLNGDRIEQKRMIKDNYISQVRANAGKKGGEKTQFAKAKPQAKGKANSEYENAIENEDENTNTKKGKKLTPPLLEDVKQYFKENGYTEESGEKAFKYYEAGNWKDATGKKVKNWKQKMIAVWFKDENKINQKSKTSSNQKTLDYQERKLQKELEEENARAIRKDL